MSEPDATALQSGRRLLVHGHEVVVHTQRIRGDRYLCFVFLTDPYDDRHELKIFKGHGPGIEEAEDVTLREALDYLDRPAGGKASSILAGRSTLNVAGRKVDIFCDLVGEGQYQAFPFLYRPDGSRVIILHFHLKESVLGASPSEAMNLCVRRLEEWFLAGGEEEGAEAGEREPAGPGEP